VYHVDLQFSVDQCVYWCRSTPSKHPDAIKSLMWMNCLKANLPNV